MSSDEILEVLRGSLRTLHGIEWQLAKARAMKGDPIAHWEAMGYVVECRYATQYRSELLGVIGTVARRHENGEDVKLLLHEGQKHCIIMSRHGNSTARGAER